MKKQCTKSKGNRIIQRNERWLRLKQKARRVLADERYIELCKQRSVEVETVFAQIKGERLKFRQNGVYFHWGTILSKFTG